MNTPSIERVLEKGVFKGYDPETGDITVEVRVYKEDGKSTLIPMTYNLTSVEQHIAQLELEVQEKQALLKINNTLLQKLTTWAS